MDLLLFVTLFPLLAAVLLLIIPHNGIRNFIIIISSLVVAFSSIYLAGVNFNLGPVFYNLAIPAIEPTMFYIEMIIGLYILYLGIKYKKYPLVALILVQSAIMIYFECFCQGHEVTNNLFIDKFSIIMALIIGVIGTLICVFSVGYMKDYHEHHKEMKDNRNFFFFVVFLFLSAMFGIVFSNNIVWLYFCWEITTLCSFLLIGYSKTEEATNNAFHALTLNLLGGVGFATGIVLLATLSGTIELDKMIALGQGAAILPAVCMAFAGATKSAQMPFSSWLLGAMVAPTPVSALLHSSTMVKAGVYLIIKLAPVFQGTAAGFMVAMLGATTFVIASCLAISQSNAKRVLAYSTVANLGLIVTCAGVGTYEALWAAILLVIFHAVAKCLLFLCVGSTEHKIGSRDIEDMDSLIMRMPKMAVMLLIGMAGMFVAPFGMLISKWAALKALVDVNPVLAIIVAFGSAATLFFWTKWMGKLMSVIGQKVDTELEKKVSITEWSSLYILAAMTILVCGLFPLLSNAFIEPYIIAIYGQSTSMSQDNVLIMAIMLALVMLMPLSLLFYGKNLRYADAYLGGTNVVHDNSKFSGSMGVTKDVTMKNYYLDDYFGEARLCKPTIVATIAIIILMFAFGVSLI